MVKMFKDKNGDLLPVKKAFFTVITVLAALGTLAGAWFGLEQKFASAKDLKTQEKQIVTTLEMFQMKIKSDINSLEKKVKFNELNSKLNLLIDRKYQLRSLVRKYPEDDELKNSLKDVLYQIRSIKEKLKELN